jgi:hypothetical protein
MVEELGKRFAQFRAENPRGARIPQELRTAAVAAWAQGVGPSAFERVCRVSWSQLKAWQARARRDGSVEKQVRVFSVVDEAAPAAEYQPAIPRPAQRELEFRLGPWSVSVRFAEA